MEPFFGPFLGYPPQISFFNKAWIGPRRGPPNFDPQKGSKNRHILHILRLSISQIIGVDIDVRAPPGPPREASPGRVFLGPGTEFSPPRPDPWGMGGMGDGGRGGWGMGDWGVADDDAAWRRCCYRVVGDGGIPGYGSVGGGSGRGWVRGVRGTGFWGFWAVIGATCYIGRGVGG